MPPPSFARPIASVNWCWNADQQRKLQSLGKAWWQRRAIRVFRDESSLSASPALRPAIETALISELRAILSFVPESKMRPVRQFFRLKYRQVSFKDDAWY